MYIPSRTPRLVTALLFVVALGCSAHAGHAQFIWQNSWTYSAPPTIGFQRPYASSGLNPSVAFSSDGEVVLSVRSTSQDDQIVRLTSTGAVRWAVDLGGNYGASPSRVRPIANADGSAFVAVEDGNDIAKIDATGSIAWMRSLPTVEFALISSQKLAIGGCASVTTLDAASGQTLWQYGSPEWVMDCPATSIIADGLGNLYAAYPTPTGFQTVKFDSAGNVIWSIDTSDVTTATAFGVSGSHLYLTTATDVRAIDIINGSTVWTAPGARGFTLVGAPGEPVVTSSTGQVQRLAASTGQPRWSQTVVNMTAYSFFSVVNDDILVDTTRLNSNNGSIVWSAVLPSTDVYGNALVFAGTGESAAGNVIAVATAQGTAAPPVLQTIDFAAGNLLGQLAIGSVTFGVEQTSMAENDGQHVIAASLIPGPTGAHITARRLNAGDGTLVWENADSSQNLPMPAVYTGLGVGGNTVAVSNVEGSYSWNGSYGAVEIDAFNKTNGNLVWHNRLWVENQGFTTAWDPVVDATGNVYVAYGTSVPCASSSQFSCKFQSLVKLSAADGALLWRFDIQGPVVDYPYIDPQPFALAGSDILIGGPFFGPYAASSVLKLSGSNGSVMWSASTPSTYVGSIAPLADGKAIVFDTDGWSEIHGVLGTVLWTNSADSPCSPGSYCAAYDGTVLPNGDALSVWETNHQAVVRLLPAAEGATPQIWYLPPDSSYLRSMAEQVKRDSSGTIWLRLVRLFRGTGSGMSILARFDPSNGALLSQQVIAAFDYDPLTESTGSLLLAAPENNHALVQTGSVVAPAPATNGNGSLDTTIRATGDVTLQVTTDHSVVMPGEMLGFQIKGTYVGDHPITSAGIHIVLPWIGHASGVTCTVQSAGNCVVDTRSDVINVSFDAQPGGTATVAGQIVVPPNSDISLLRAFAYGPAELDESDTVNNFGVATIINDHIFSTGFEQ